MPSVPPPGGAPNRTPLFVTLGVLVAVAAVVAVIAIASGGDDDPNQDPVSQQGSTTAPDETTVPDVTEPDDDPPDEPADASALTVAEVGWSTYLDSFGEDTTGSYGFVVENTGDAVLTNISLSVTVYDESEGIVSTESQTVGLIRPGEKLGYADELYGEDLTNGIGDVKVQVGESPFPGDPPPDGALTISDVSTTGDEYGMTTTFSVTSTYDQQLDYPSAYAIFRDAAGKIIGGTYGSVQFVPPGGSQAGELSSLNPVPNVATTEVYVDPGYFF